MEEMISDEDALKEMVLLKGKGMRQQEQEALYTEAVPRYVPAEVKAIPYYAWGNRGLNQMRVWMPRL